MHNLGSVGNWLVEYCDYYVVFVLDTIVSLLQARLSGDLAKTGWRKSTLLLWNASDMSYGCSYTNTLFSETKLADENAVQYACIF